MVKKILRMIQGWSGESSKANCIHRESWTRIRFVKTKNLYFLPIEGSERSIGLALSNQTKIELDPVWLVVIKEQESLKPGCREGTDSRARTGPHLPCLRKASLYHLRNR